MPPRGPAGSTGATALRASALGALGPASRAASNLQLTNNLIWAMIAIGTAGAIVTFSFLVYALWRFRDPKVKGRRYG